MVAIFMNLIQLLIFFCQKIQFRSNTSRCFSESQFKNMWVCFVFCPQTQLLPLDSKKTCHLKVNLPFECPRTQNLHFDSDVEFFQKWKGISHSKGNASRMWHFCPLMTKLPLKTKCYNLIIYLRSKSAFRLWWNMPSEGKSALSMPSECPQIFTVYVNTMQLILIRVW